MVRRLSKSRFLLPASVLLAVGLGSLVGLSSWAGAQPKAPSASHAATLTATSGTATSGTATSGSATRNTPAGATTGPATPTAGQQATSTAGASRFQNIPPQTTTGTTACERAAAKISYASPRNSGSPHSSDPTYLQCTDGHVTQYGSSAIIYKAPPKSYIKPGEALFEEYCSSCHMPNAQGSSAAPPLIGVGPAVVDFWVSTGRMPAATPLAVQATAKPPRLTDHQALQIAAFINSLSPAAPYIPSVNLKGADLTNGADLFSLNCAACHTITGMGDALAKNTFSSSLHYATARQVAEAIRTGPGNMPRFTGNLTDAQVRDVTAYVTDKIQHPSNDGGFGLGGIGPVAEGFVALLFGIGGLMLVCFWIGDRA